MIKHFILVQIIVLSIIPKFIQAQEQPFSLDACIKYAWENSTEISRASNSVGIQNAYLAQSKAERGPNLFMNGSQTLNSSRSYENSDTGGSWKQNSSSKLSVSLNSEITLYNGAKLKNTIAQNKTNLAASETDIQTQKELISLNILSAYINALLTIENVKNSESQLQSTKKQFELAEARKSAGIISASDFLNIKSQYASDKALVINAKNTLRINYVALMQLMNMPINDSFSIQEPDIDALLKIASESDANLIYKTALGLQPTIKSAELNLESAKMDAKIAQAGALPQLSLGGSLGSGYSSDMSGINFGEQFSNKINPSIGFSLSIPIFQRK
ncbi:MAG: TolC family protein [Labilibaculum sp.]|nr:TolC family protein [Labilibaculum sp.]MBI9058892.1 TolC family protein [Labilibaculum sp.]